MAGLKMTYFQGAYMIRDGEHEYTFPVVVRMRIHLGESDESRLRQVEDAIAYNYCQKSYAGDYRMYQVTDCAKIPSRMGVVLFQSRMSKVRPEDVPPFDVLRCTHCGAVLNPEYMETRDKIEEAGDEYIPNSCPQCDEDVLLPEDKSNDPDNNA